jgi:hypothetical protein
MDPEAEEAYEERQKAPLFQNARDMVPMEQVKQVFENLQCGYAKRDGCKLLVRDRSFYACLWHQAMQATGEDFMIYHRLIMENDNEISRMSSQQHKKLEERYVYEKQWLKDNFHGGNTS